MCEGGVQCGGKWVLGRFTVGGYKAGIELWSD